MDDRHPVAPEGTRLPLFEGRPIATIVLLGVFLAPAVFTLGFDLTVDPVGFESGRTRDRMEWVRENPELAIASTAGLAALLIWGMVHAYLQLGRYLDVGPEGLRYVRKRHSTLVPWRDVAAVGYAYAKPHFASRFARRVPAPTFQLLVNLRDPADPRHERLLRRWGTADEYGRPRRRLRFQPFPWEAVQRGAAVIERHAPGSWRGETRDG